MAEARHRINYTADDFERFDRARNVRDTRKLVRKSHLPDTVTLRNVYVSRARFLSYLGLMKRVNFRETMP